MPKGELKYNVPIVATFSSRLNRRNRPTAANAAVTSNWKKAENRLHCTSPKRSSTSVFQKLQGLFGVQRTFVARCFECAGEREVPKTATSTLCPKCGAYIDLQDYKISSIYTRSIRTGGRLIITNKGDLIGRTNILWLG